MKNTEWFEKLAEMRGKKRIEEVCAETGLSVDTYMAYESGKKCPVEPVKKILADYFGVGVTEIWT